MSKQQQTVTDRLEANGWVVNKFRQMDSSRRLVTENQIRGEGVNHPWMDRQLLNTDGKLLDSQWWWVDGWWIIRTEGYFPGVLMLVGGGCGGEWMDTFCCCWLWSHGLQHARLPCPYQLLELAQTHAHQVGDAIQPSSPLSSPSPAFNLCQYQGLFKWVSSSLQVAKVLELQLQHHSFQRIFRTDFH